MRDAIQAEFSIFNASNIKLALVVSLFNREITDRLKESAILRAREYEINSDDIGIFEVAGAIEIPLVLQKLAKMKKYDILLAIGCVIKGETPHFDYVCKFVSEGILAVQLQENMPIGFGVLTCSDKEQAIARQNLGSDHLDAVLHQFKLIQNM